MHEELYHHGVKGMKWGVRRTPAQLGHKTSTKKKASNKDRLDEITKKIDKYSSNFESSRKARSERKQAKVQEKTAEQKARSERKQAKVQEKTAKQKASEEQKQAKEATKQAKEATKQAMAATKQMEKASKKPEPKKKLSELSDDELRERINRLEMEQKYKKLVSDNNPKIKTGRDMVNEIVSDVGKDLAKQTIKHYGAKGLNRLIGEEAVYANNKKK